MSGFRQSRRSFKLQKGEKDSLRRNLEMAVKALVGYAEISRRKKTPNSAVLGIFSSVSPAEPIGAGRGICRAPVPPWLGL